MPVWSDCPLGRSGVIDGTAMEGIMQLQDNVKNFLIIFSLGKDKAFLNNYPIFRQKFLFSPCK